MSTNNINNRIKNILARINELKKQIPSDISDNDLFVNNNFISLNYCYQKIRKMYEENKHCIDNDIIELILQEINIKN